MASPHTPDPAEKPLRILVYSDDRTMRDRVSMALGVRPVLDLPPVQIDECATVPFLLSALDAGGVDLAILDGEAVPAGGIGLCRQIKDEVFGAPPILVLIGRVQDAWLATWARADETVIHPANPMELTDKVVSLLRARRAGSGSALATT